MQSDHHFHQCDRCGLTWGHFRSVVKMLGVNVEAHTCPMCDLLIQTGPVDRVEVLWMESYYGANRPYHLRGEGEVNVVR